MLLVVQWKDILPLQFCLVHFPNREYLGSHTLSILFSLFCFRRFGVVLEDTSQRNPTVQAIVSSSRPSFLVWDKVYQKFTDVEEETWLLRAVESTAIFFSSEAEKAEQLRFVFRYICVYSVCPGAN